MVHEISRGSRWLTVPGVIALVGAVALQAACDTRCVGPSCEVDRELPDPVLDTDDGDPGRPDLDALRDEEVDELPAQRSCTVVRRHQPPFSVNSVAIAGSFNGWQPAPMTRDEDGWWVAELGELSPGSYPFKYLYNGNWEQSVPTSSLLEWSGGVENRSLRVGDCARPDLRVISGEATAGGVLSADIRYARGVSGDPLDPARVEATVGGRPVEVSIDTTAQILSIRESGLPQGKHTVRVRAFDTAGREAESEIFLPLWVEPTPFEWTDGLLYLVFTDRFRNGDPSSDQAPIAGVAARANFNGGDLLGVQHAIEEGWFDELGVRSIWLSPLYENPEGGFLGVYDGSSYTGYHGYWPVRARAVESRYGDSELSAHARLKEMVRVAHEHGIRVVLDAVYNHVHDQHEWLSERPEWFGQGCVCGAPGCGWEERPIECWFTPYLPDLDHTNPWITEQLIEDTLWWVREFDLDGLRIDAVKHMHRAMTVNLRHRVFDEIERGGGAHVYMVGETFTGGGAQQELAQRIGPFEMDGQFDFPFYWTVRGVFAHGGSMRELEDTINAGRAAWGDAPMSPFAGNHDIGRLATELAGNDQGPWGDTPDLLAGGGDAVTEPWLIDTQAMALAVALTQPGVPLLYYGDEIGLAGSGDPDNRRLMSFEPFLSANRRALLEKVRRVGSARAELRGLQRGRLTPLWASQDVLAYGRGEGDDAVIVVVNRGADRTTSIPLQGLVPDGTVLRDRMVDGRSFTVSGGAVQAALAGNDVAILAE